MTTNTALVSDSLPVCRKVIIFNNSDNLNINNNNNNNDNNKYNDIYKDSF